MNAHIALALCLSKSFPETLYGRKSKCNDQPSETALYWKITILLPLVLMALRPGRVKDFARDIITSIQTPQTRLGPSLVLQPPKGADLPFML